MTIVCISPQLTPQTPVYPGDTPFGVTWEAESAGDFTLSSFEMSPHVGAHLDAPKHRDGGWASIDAIDLEACVGRALVWDVSDREGTITVEELAGLPQGLERLLLKTNRPEGTAFDVPYRALSQEAVVFLKTKNLRLIGIDAPGLDAPGVEGAPDSAHSVLLGAGVLLLENLVLTAVDAGLYELMALPLKMVGLEASPVRAVLRTID